MFSIQHVIAIQAAGVMSLASIIIRPMETRSLFEAITFSADIYGRQLPINIYAGDVSEPGATTIEDPFPSHIDNPITLDFLRNAGRSGYLIDARVFRSPLSDLSLSPYNRHLRWLSVVSLPTTVLYILSPALTVTAVVVLGCIQDWWALGVLMTLIISRLIHVGVAVRRSTQDLSMQPTGGKYDLLIRFNQDRWIRLQGTEADLRTVIACQGMRPRFAMERFAIFFGRVLAYLAVALSPNASPVGCWIIVCLVFSSSIIIALRSSFRPCLQTVGRVVHVVGEPMRYEERLSQTTTEGDERGVFVSLRRRGEDVA
ncbi:hypothetical protein IW261DRAFT_1610778 [Armillaria novae-zelandiae]|uniref:Uncharacterized protein n=1 Tax=Armillaria novae-zelandiae TaxID=153914 RepID=A0AA39NYD2_9AGAR|nr:hypothetical protein IW261DRAFT_1610778 [Armillaria novae-zelandiae]